ncbi:MAG: hypothetical protein PHE51_03095 [Eubacteriales bacterium]|nr:hypothetical protein [Eubacteriales bacterium]
MNNYEIEHKYLIAYPDEKLFEKLGAKKVVITQTYLSAPKGITARVRSSVIDGVVKYTHTIKQRINALKCIEDEKEVTEEEYKSLLKQVNPSLNPISKIRYKLPYDKHIFEIDVYPFWKNQAVMEVEIASEGEEYEIPPVIQIIKEVTDDVRYKNFALASGNLPDENKEC